MKCSVCGKKGGLSADDIVRVTGRIDEVWPAEGKRVGKFVVDLCQVCYKLADKAVQFMEANVQADWLEENGFPAAAEALRKAFYSPEEGGT